MNDFGDHDPFPAPWTSERWTAYFHANAAGLLTIPWHRGAELTEEERAAVGRSIQEFQRGESSEGRNLLRLAREHAAATGDAAYAPAVQLFIGEEQRHARDLGLFLDLAGLPRLEKTWPDQVFRRFRKGAGLELSICVLVTAEIVAQVYYSALRRATGSAVLRRLCEQILDDEVQHVRFQAERLTLLRRGRGRWRNAGVRFLQRVFFAGTSALVWLRHRRAYRAAGYSLSRFATESWHALGDALERMDPNGYASPRQASSPPDLDHPGQTEIPLVPSANRG